MGNRWKWRIKMCAKDALATPLPRWRKEKDQSINYNRKQAQIQKWIPRRRISTLPPLDARITERKQDEFNSKSSRGNQITKGIQNCHRIKENIIYILGILSKLRLMFGFSWQSTCCDFNAVADWRDCHIGFAAGESGLIVGPDLNDKNRASKWTSSSASLRVFRFEDRQQCRDRSNRI